jgi:RHS repeat-associated protein
MPNTGTLLPNPNSTSFITALGNAFGVSSTSTGDQLKLYNGLNTYAAMVPSGDHANDDETAPKCFATIILLDKNYNYVNAAWQQISTNCQQTSPTVKTPPFHDFLSKELTVTEPGYAYVFLSNEHYNFVDVYFDDVTLTHIQSAVVAGSDYYPFGLAMKEREVTDEEYRYGYQGQFSEKDLTTGMQEFELRMYDPRIGRWMSPDPYGQFASPYLAMGNIPHMATDPNGGWCCGGDKIAFEVMGREVMGAVATRIPAQAISTAALTTVIISRAIPGRSEWQGATTEVDYRGSFY